MTSWGKRHNDDPENTDIKNRRLNIEAVMKMDDYFTICQYKTGKFK